MEDVLAASEPAANPEVVETNPRALKKPKIASGFAYGRISADPVDDVVPVAHTAAAVVHRPGSDVVAGPAGEPASARQRLHLFGALTAMANGARSGHGSRV